MDGTENGTVAQFLAKLCQSAVEFFLIHLTKHLFAKICRCLLHIGRNGCVVVGQIRMGTLGICDTQAVSVSFKVHVNFLYIGVGRICKVNVNETAHGRSCLIHQSAWFAKIYIFCILSKLGDIHRIKLHVIV